MKLFPDWLVPGADVSWTTHVDGYYFPTMFLAKVVRLTAKRVVIAIPRQFAGPDEKTVSPRGLRQQTPGEAMSFARAWAHSEAVGIQVGDTDGRAAFAGKVDAAEVPEKP